MTTTQEDHRELVVELRRLQAENERLQAELEGRNPLSGVEAMRLGMEAIDACGRYQTGTYEWATALTRFYERRLGAPATPSSLIASSEIVSDGPVHVMRLHLTNKAREGLTSAATGPLPGTA